MLAPPHRVQTTITLGLLMALVMAAIAIVNASLMAWLWRFPLDANGKSTAPRLPTNIHRGLGYVFAITYVVLLVEMIPRAWEFREATAISVVHGVLGVFIGVVLAFKIAVIRRLHRFGHRLPWIGGTLAVTTLIVSGLGVVPAWIVTRPLTTLTTTLTPELERGRQVVSNKCNQCHGASTIASEREDARKWDRITREMQRFSRTSPGKEPISDEERLAAASYLAFALGEEDDDDEKHEDDRRGRGRGRRR